MSVQLNLGDKLYINDEKSTEDLDQNYDDDYDDEDDQYNYDDDHNNNYICDSEGEMDDDNDIFQIDPEIFEYEIYPMNKIDSILDKKCEKILNALNLDDPLDSLYLLKQFNWNPKTLLEVYNKDKSSFLLTYFSDDNNNNSKKSSSIHKNKLVSYLNIYSESQIGSRIKKDAVKCKNIPVESYCNICCSSRTSSEMLSLDECGHLFCTECWQMHFESLIGNSSGHFFECMQTKCNVVAGKDFVLKCLENTDSNRIEKYKKLVVLDLVNESEDLQICPGELVIKAKNSIPSTPKTHVSHFKLISTVTSTPTVSFNFKSTSPVTELPQETKKCDSIVWIKNKPSAKRVVCTTCETQFCFLCSTPYHAPNNCSTIRKWNLKCQDDSETRNYLLVHTQDCPKCKVCIEKNGGCSHMTCNRCKHEFCWVCGNDWKTHGPTYDCNRYKGNSEQDTAREALNRYTHYYHRWINHSNSLKFEKALREQCQLKITEKIMNKEGGTLVDWEFLTEAVDILTKARYTLQYTYPYAYYLESNEVKMLFENIQAELEREVENLSHSLEKVNLNDKFNIKIQMSIVEKRRKTLLKDFFQ
ncbi:unnamed protein product [Brachionus calyciflorus]|uniref:RBR-type E3 ubiquitin transferase n=1 Tax=Brachionus calyciflorus TaxID=104777 RepID=A0A813W5L9_9BILA|nr:unnamed protein product [Brachionus calyciflorus]